MSPHPRRQRDTARHDPRQVAHDQPPGHLLERFAVAATEASGRSEAFLVAVGIVLVWVVVGPIFNFSDTWQLVINTGTTIVTFLMVFLIQRTQNKEALALHVKLNELIAAFQGASNRLIDAEDLSEDELKALHEQYRTLNATAEHEASRTQAHSIDETEQTKRQAPRSSRRR